MGSCISKCIPRKHSELEEFDHHDHHHDEDKLVISQAPTSTIPNIIPVSNKISPSPPSPSNSSTCSLSSYSGTTTSKYKSSSSSTSSSASSVICSKDRSFSNEYLWSCYKENPHIIRINSLKESSTLSSLPAKPRKLEAAKQQPNPQKVSNWSTTSTTPQKRVRSRSPTLTRKKSFRRDQPERPTSTHSLQQSRALRSPSPSRRFSNINNGDKYWGGHVTNTLKESQSKRMTMSGTTTPLGFKVNTAGYASGLSYSRMENLRPPLSTPNSSCSSSRLVGPLCLRNTREPFIHRIGSKIDEFAVAEALAHPDSVDAVPMEDIDNPLIALDCFIFL